MKLVLNNARLFLCYCVIGMLSTNCATESTDNLTPNADCRIQKVMSVSKSKFYDETAQTIYDYDATGKLLKTGMTTDKKPLNGATGSQTGNKTITYTYGTNGFLTASTTQELYILTMPDKTYREQITTTDSYLYASGRLSGFTIKRVGDYGVTETVASAFVYDGAGELITKTQVISSVVHDPALVRETPGGTSTRIWTYQKNQLVDYTEKSGTTERRPFTIQNGVVTKMGDATYELRYEYDSQRRILKQENFDKGQLVEYYSQTWADAKPSSASLPLFKGFPAVPVNGYDNLSPAGVLATKKMYFLNPVSKTIYLYEESTATVQTNARGFTSGAVIMAKHPDLAAASQDVTTTETYTYSGCQ